MLNVLTTIKFEKDLNVKHKTIKGNMSEYIILGRERPFWA